MVGARLDRSRAGPGMDYRSADDLLGSWLHVAEPRPNFGRSIANGNRKTEPSGILARFVACRLFSSLRGASRNVR